MSCNARCNDSVMINSSVHDVTWWEKLLHTNMFTAAFGIGEPQGEQVVWARETLNENDWYAAAQS